MAKTAEIRVNVGTGDVTTADIDLIFKVYNGLTLIATYGSAKTDFRVQSLGSGDFILHECPITEGGTTNINVTITNELAEESTPSATVPIVSDPATNVAGTLTQAAQNRLRAFMNVNMDDLIGAKLLAFKIFNGSVLSKGDTFIRFDNLTGNLSGFSINNYAEGWITGVTYAMHIVVRDKSPELTALTPYNNNAGSGVGTVVPISLGYNYFEWTSENTAPTGDAIWTVTGSPIGTGYFIEFSDFALYKLP